MEQPGSLISDYLQLSQQYTSKYGSRTVVLMQVGAFFEMYGLKNTLGSLNEVCQLCSLNTSDKKICVGQEQVVMAGFRDYTLDKYITKLTDGGYTAVVYVQEKNGKNITRALHAVYSPGTYVSCDTDSSPQITNNIMCMWFDLTKSFRTSKDTLVCGVSVVNVFTGKSHLFEYECPFYMNPTTFDELERCVSVFSPSELVVVSPFDRSRVDTILQYAGVKCSAIHRVDSATSEKALNCAKQIYVRHILSRLFGAESHVVCAEFDQCAMATQSFCFLSDFIQEHNPDLLNKVGIPTFNNTSTRMILANHTLKQLNMIGDEGHNMSVNSMLNKCRTPMGRRMMHHQMTNPTFNEHWLNDEYSAIDMFLTNYHFVDMFRQQLASINDLEKILRQLVLRKLYPMSVHHLYSSICAVRQISTCLYEDKAIVEYLSAATNVDDICGELIHFIDAGLDVEKCRNIQSLTSFDCNIMNKGVSAELDLLIVKQDRNVEILNGIQHYFNNLLAKDDSDTTEYVKKHETEKSYVTLQLTKKRASLIRTALGNGDSVIDICGVQFRTSEIQFLSASAGADEISIPALNVITKDIFHLNDAINERIVVVYNEFLAKLENLYYDKVEKICEFVARMDVIQSKAYVARNYNYCRPVIDASAEKSFVNTVGLRHCLIEHIQTNELYVANDVHIGCSMQNGMLLYGTNAVGKTSLIRALGISVILAQCGMYVPCARFTFKPYTAIYSRILGNDNLFKGLSTFAVEMSELRIILKMADKNSLVLGDEICSGTETESALSIFVAALMDLHSKAVSFVFATHFHEIIKFDEISKLDTMVLAHMSVSYDRAKDCLVYDRKLKPGSGNRMYGLEVCKSLYLDEDFMNQAYAIRNKYFPDNRGELSHETTIYNAKKIRGFCEICKSEVSDEIHHMYQQKDATEDGFIGSFHMNHPANLMPICEKCHDLIHADDVQYVRKKTTNGFTIQK